MDHAAINVDLIVDNTFLCQRAPKTSSIKNDVDLLAQIIAVPGVLLPSFGYWDDGEHGFKAYDYNNYLPYTNIPRPPGVAGK